MPDPRWMAIPEITAGIFEAGPGPGSVMASQAVWVSEAISHELSAGLSMANAAATAAEWTGMGGAASGISSFGLNTGLHTLVGWVTHKVAVTAAAAEAYLIAASAVIPSTVSASNRAETAALIGTNFFGQNTPAIAALQAQYQEFWAQNSSIGTTYASTLAGLMGNLGVPPPPAPMGASPAAPAAAAQVAARAAAQTGAKAGLRASEQAAGAPARAAAAGEPAAMGQMGSFMQQGTQMMSSMGGQANSMMGAPMQAMRSFTNAPQSLMSMFSSMGRGGSFGANPGMAGALAEPMRVGAGAVGGVGHAGGAGGGFGGGAGGYPGAGLTSYTRPSGTFGPEAGGRPAGRPGALNAAAELHGPTARAMGGGPMPMSQAGMLGRSGGEQKADQVTHARIVTPGMTGSSGEDQR